MNVPKLRFTGFYGDWEKNSLKNLSNEISYGMNSSSKEYDGKNAYIRITDIDENTGRFNKNNIVSPDGNLENKYLVNDNDILFARTGASTGKTYLYSKEDGKLYYAGFLIKASIKKDYDSNFIYQQTKTSKYKKWVKIMSMRSGQPGINLEEYGSYLFSITIKKEQEKISNLLKLIDKKIELQSQKIEALKLYKTCIINNVFNIFNLQNNKVKLESLLTEITERSKINNEYKILSSTTKGIFLQSEYFNKQAASENTIGYKILRKNQLVLSPQNLWMGNININMLFDIGIVSPSYKIFNIKEKIIDINIFNEWIKSPRTLHQFLIASEQGASIVRRNLNIDLFKEITINIPELSEQRKYGKLFKKINNKLFWERERLFKLQQIKKGLIQNMFV